MAASREFDSSEYDLGTTSVRMLRVGNVIQLIFSNKFDAMVYQEETCPTFKRVEEKMRRDLDES